MIAYLPETSPEERAILRAATEGVQVERLGQGSEAGIWLASSVSRPGVWHAVRDGRCDCEGAQAGRYCKHVAAVELATAGQREAHRCQSCGHFGYDVARFVEHIGGVGDGVAVYRCADLAACFGRAGL